MQNGSKSRVKKSPWPSRQGSIDGEKQSRALYNMYGPDDSRAPQKGTKLARYRTTHLAVPTPCIHTYIPTACRYCPSIHQYVCKHTCTYHHGSWSSGCTTAHPRPSPAHSASARTHIKTDPPVPSTTIFLYRTYCIPLSPPHPTSHLQLHLHLASHTKGVSRRARGRQQSVLNLFGPRLQPQKPPRKKRP
jgi:hypothetical protein